MIYREWLILTNIFTVKTSDYWPQGSLKMTNTTGSQRHASFQGSWSEEGIPVNDTQKTSIFHFTEHDLRFRSVFLKKQKLAKSLQIAIHHFHHSHAPSLLSDSVTTSFIANNRKNKRKYK